MLGLGRHLVAAGDLANRKAVLRLLVLRHQLGEQLVDQLRRRSQRIDDLRLRQRLLGDVNHGFEHRFGLGLGR